MLGFYFQLPAVGNIGLFIIGCIVFGWLYWYYKKQRSTTLTIYLKDDEVWVKYDRATAGDGPERVEAPLADFETITADVQSGDVTLARHQLLWIPLPKDVVRIAAGRVDFKKKGEDKPTFWIVSAANPYGITEWLTSVRKLTLKIAEEKKKVKAREEQIAVTKDAILRAAKELQTTTA